MAAGGVCSILVRDCTDTRSAPGGVPFPTYHVACPVRVDPDAVCRAAALRGPVHGDLNRSKGKQLAKMFVQEAGL